MAKQLNIQATRGKRELDAPKITAPDGTVHVVHEMSIDSYIGILDLEDRFEKLRAQEKAAGGQPDRVAQRDLFNAFCDMITVLVPGFPARTLSLPELFAVLTFVQEAHTPEGEEAAGDGTSGEALKS